MQNYSDLFQTGCCVKKNEVEKKKKMVAQRCTVRSNDGVPVHFIPVDATAVRPLFSPSEKRASDRYAARMHD